MKTKHLLIIGLTASSLAMGSSQAMAGTFLIDSFDVPTISPPGFPPSTTGTNPIVVNNFGPTGVNTFTGLPQNEVIGGQRKATLTQTQNTPTGQGFNSSASVYTGSGNYDGTFNIENNSRTNSTTTLLWDNIGMTGQGNFNVLTGANDEKGIKIDYFSTGIAFNFELIVSDGMNMSSVMKPFTPGGVATTGSALFSFEEILTGVGGPIDLSMVNYVSLIITGAQGFDLEINQIGSYEVPEPSALLGLLAVLGTAAFSIKGKTQEK